MVEPAAPPVRGPVLRLTDSGHQAGHVGSVGSELLWMDGCIRQLLSGAGLMRDFQDTTYRGR